MRDFTYMVQRQRRINTPQAVLLRMVHSMVHRMMHGVVHAMVLTVMQMVVQTVDCADCSAECGVWCRLWCRVGYTMPCSVHHGARHECGKLAQASRSSARRVHMLIKDKCDN